MYPQWLKDSNNEISYARVMGFVCIVFNLFGLFAIGIDSINNMWQAIVACSGFLTAIFLWLIEIFRKLPNFSIKAGDKEYSIKRTTDETRNTENLS